MMTMMELLKMAAILWLTLVSYTLVNREYVWFMASFFDT